MLHTINAKLLTGFISVGAVLIFLGVSGVVFSNLQHRSGQNVGADLAPLADATMEIKLTATQAHLLLEEILAGDAGEDVEEVWRLLDETRFYVDAILNGGENEEGIFVATTDPEVRLHIDIVRESVEAFIESAHARYDRYGAGQGVGSEADVAFDALYDGLVDRLGAIPVPAENPAAFNRAIGDARYHLANGHLLVAEILGGDAGEDFEEALANFEAAAAAVAGLGVDQAIGADIDRLISFAEERYVTHTNRGAAGSDADRQFDAAFETFIEEADIAEEILHDAMDGAMADLQTVGETALLWMLAGSLIGLALIVFVYVAVVRRVSSRLSDLETRTLALADGDLAVEISDRGSHDEIGRIFGALATLKENAIREREAQAEKIRAAEAESRRAETLGREIEDFRQGIASVLEDVAGNATELRATAQTLSAGAQTTSNEAAQAAASAQQSNQAVQTVASAAEEMTASIDEVTRQMVKARDAMRVTADHTSSIEKDITSLQDMGEKIREVMSLIQGIAEQTNLLALNATIEAARAGDAGKGFAVVASEVKSLAGQTAKATEEIGAQVEQMTAAIEKTTQGVDAIAGSIHDINDQVTTVAGAVEQQTAATGEISRNAVEAAKGSQDASGNVERVQVIASEASDGAGRVLNGADEMTVKADGLRRQVETFLERIKAA